MVMVVADPRFIACDGAGRLNFAYQARRGQRSQHVVNGLAGHLGQPGPDDTENSFGIGMRVRFHGFQHGDPGPGHAQIGRAQQRRVLIRCEGYEASMPNYLESIQEMRKTDGGIPKGS